jgi:hypothetical protein
MDLSSAEMNEVHAQDPFLADAERYCAAAGIKLSTLGLYAVGNSRFFANLKAGRPCLTSTLERVRRYMQENPRPEPTTAAPADRPAEDESVNAAGVAAE